MPGACELHWCKSGQPASVRVLENIGDGAFAAHICGPCAGALSLASDGDLPDAAKVQRVLAALYGNAGAPPTLNMIGNITEPEAMTLRICAERNGGCHCARAWGYPKDAYAVCAALLAKAKVAVETIKAERGRA